MRQFETDFDSPTRARIRRRLLGWYGRTQRDLPWRRRASDAYAQMLAELMLQQTQVATVIGYYERFIAKYPTVADLARADIDDVLALWSGLGYYRRARHLHAAARVIVEHHHAVVPSDLPSLMALPGIGRYTAGAIASIAYDCRAAVLDGNVARVLVRLLGIQQDPKLPALREHLWSIAEQMLPRSRCGDFNQALMELGATLCRPKSPACQECPVRTDCRAHSRGLTDRIPKASRRPRVQAIGHVVAAIQRDHRLLFVQRPMSGLWAGLWELPNEPLAPGESAARALGRLRRRIGLKCRIKGTQVGTTTRQLTHRTVSFQVFRGQAPTAEPLDGELFLGEPGRPRAAVAQAGYRSADPDGGTRSVSAGQAARWLAPEDLPLIGLSRASLAILRLIRWPS